MTVIWLSLALVMGACVALQGTINTSLAAKIGTGETLLANTLVLVVGSVIVVFAMPWKGEAGISRFVQAPWYEYTGGVLGFLVVFLAVVLFPRLGAGLTLSLAIAAQLILAVAIDHFGFMGVPEHALTWQRLVGLGLLVGGTALVKFY